MWVKLVLFLLILSSVGLFLYLGLPALDKIKEAPVLQVYQTKENVSLVRYEVLNISIESMCRNMITDELYDRCNEENCDSTCEEEGCKFFGLQYESSEYRDSSCLCQCNENKIRKALSPQPP